MAAEGGRNGSRAAELAAGASEIGRKISGALGRKALDWLFPPGCLICAEEADVDGGLCVECWRDMRWIDGDGCPTCAAPFGTADPVISKKDAAASCTDCASHPRGWRRGAAVSLYDGAGRNLVLALKHGDRVDAARAMGGWMARAAKELLAAEPEAEPPLLTPTPLHWTRRVQRRFNQSLALAQAMAATRTAKTCGALLAPDLLRRVRRTERQAGFNPSQRRANVGGAFVLAPGAAATLAGRRIILVDDVLTTGATLSECAHVLRDGGAAAVDVIVFARAARDPLASDFEAPISVSRPASRSDTAARDGAGAQKHG